MVTASLFYPALHHFKSSLQIMIILCYVRCVLWFHRSRAEQESENARKGQKYTKTNKQNTPKYRIIKLSCETRLNIICAINLVSVPALIKKLPLEGEIRTVKLSMKLSINPSLVMMREWLTLRWENLVHNCYLWGTQEDVEINKSFIFKINSQSL